MRLACITRVGVQHEVTLQVKRSALDDSRPRPVLALAVFADGRKVPLLGWVVKVGETLQSALHRTAVEDGAEYAEIVATLH